MKHIDAYLAVSIAVLIAMSGCSGAHTSPVPVVPGGPTSALHTLKPASVSTGLALNPSALIISTLRTRKTITAAVNTGTVLYAGSSDPAIATVSPASVHASPSQPATFTVTSVAWGASMITVTDKNALNASLRVGVSPWLPRPPLQFAAEQVLANCAFTGVAGTAGGALYVPLITAFNEPTFFYAYNPSTGATVAKASMPTYRYCMSFGNVAGVLYAVGGFDWDGFPEPTVYAYDPSTNTWHQKANVTHRGAFSVATVNNVLFAVGAAGYLDPEPNWDTLEAYNASANKWTTLAGLPSTRYGGYMEAVGKKLYVVGGCIDPYCNNPQQTLDIYDTAKNTWSQKEPWPALPSPLGTAVVNGVFYVIEPSSDINGASVYAYNAINNTWVNANAPTPEQNLGRTAVTVGNTVYLIGGPGGDHPDPYTYAWTPAQ